MDENTNLIADYLVDEFGRIIIKEIELLEYINGAGDLRAASTNNYGCGSNAGCANARCKK